MKRKTSPWMIAAIVLLAGILLGITGFFLYRAGVSAGAEKEIAAQQAAELAASEAEPAPEPTPTPTPTPAPTPTPTPYVSPIDFEALWEVNPHVIGWIDIPGTTIQYPILQHPTMDDYYLEVTLEGNGGLPGSIYCNALEGQHFDTFNTVIYGHNMADGSMFGQLRNYADPEFARSHPDIIIYTPTEEIHYKVCANVIYTDEYVTMIYDDNIPQDRDAFLRSAHNEFAGTYWLDEYEVTGDSHIITLQTCIGDDAFRRFVIAVADEVISTGRVIYDP